MIRVAVCGQCGKEIEIKAASMAYVALSKHQSQVHKQEVAA